MVLVLSLKKVRVSGNRCKQAVNGAEGFSAGAEAEPIGCMRGAGVVE